MVRAVNHSHQMDAIIKQVHFDDENEIIDNFRKEKVRLKPAGCPLFSVSFVL